MNIISEDSLFLSKNDHPEYRIRCPIHGFIHFSENERKIIDHPVFQRLRYIRQLALTELIYPGATNTRFEHSLGVMEIATRAFDSLIRKQGQLLTDTFSPVEEFKEKTIAKARQLLRLAALLHDIGHACFSHAAEKVIFKNSSHEDFTIQILTENELGRIIDRLYWEGCAGRIAQIIQLFPKSPPQFKVLHDIVSGEMDADRSDFLLRDSLCCGVDYGRFDYRRMIECLDIYQKDDNLLEIALTRGGIHTFEALILARYQMNTQVYYHRLRSIYDKYIEEYLKTLGEECPSTMDEILAHNDVTMMSKISRDSFHAEGERKKWAEKIYRRKHHRQVFETGFNVGTKGIMNAKRLFEDLRQKYTDFDFIFKEASANIHKQGELEGSDVIELMLVEKGKKSKPILEESQILSKIPKKFMCGRIFVDIDRENKRKREEVELFANKRWHEMGG